MCLNKIRADWKKFLRLEGMTFLAVAISKFLADSSLTTIFHFHAPLYFPIPVRSRSRSNKIPQEKLFLWYFRCYWMQHQEEISWETLSLHSFQAPLWKPKWFGRNKQQIGILRLGWLKLQHFWSCPFHSKVHKPCDDGRHRRICGWLTIVWTFLSVQLCEMKGPARLQPSVL